MNPTDTQNDLRAYYQEQEKKVLMNDVEKHLLGLSEKSSWEVVEEGEVIINYSFPRRETHFPAGLKHKVSLMITSEEND